MVTAAARVAYFLTGLFPLLYFYHVILLLRGQIEMSIALLVAAEAGLVLLASLFYALASMARTSLVVKELGQMNWETAAYFAGYLMPFLLLSLSDMIQLLAGGVSFSIFAVLLLRSGGIQISPTFILMGFQSYRIRTTSGTEMGLLARRRIRRGDIIEVVSLGENHLYAF